MQNGRAIAIGGRIAYFERDETHHYHLPEGPGSRIADAKEATIRGGRVGSMRPRDVRVGRT